MNKYKSKMMLHGKNVNFRKITKSDLHILQRWRNSTDVFLYNTQYVLLNMIDQKNWYEQIMQKNSDRIMFMVVNKLNAPIGVCGLIHNDLKNKSASIAIIIGEKKFQNKGFGTEILQILIDYGFNKLKIHRLEADVFVFNEASIKFFQKNNFTQEVILRDSLWRRGKWWDVFIFSILQNEWLQKT